MRFVIREKFHDHSIVALLFECKRYYNPERLFADTFIEEKDQQQTDIYMRHR